jgi:hypothetical protein
MPVSAANVVDPGDAARRRPAYRGPHRPHRPTADDGRERHGDSAGTDADRPRHGGAAERAVQPLFETFDAREDLFAADVLFDLNVPVGRFQLQGPRAFTAQLRHSSRGAVRIDVLRTVPRSSGFVTEHEEHQDVDGQDLTARRLWLC